MRVRGDIQSATGIEFTYRITRSNSARCRLGYTVLLSGTGEEPFSENVSLPREVCSVDLRNDGLEFHGLFGQAFSHED